MKRAKLKTTVDVHAEVTDQGKTYANPIAARFSGVRLTVGTTVDILRAGGLQVLVRGEPYLSEPGPPEPVVVKAWRDNLTFLDPYTKARHRERLRSELGGLFLSGATHVLVTDAAEPYGVRMILPRMSLRETMAELTAREVVVHEVYSKRVDLFLQLLEAKAWHLD